ncbi:DUF1616 domain-containing protein [Haladaptatus cibarius]|uniref:DUF1616 domain-containing protein n=1 Tax=Haladaptatus cibarius TaxID=453847 RepID=UPI00067978F6|nr:DUF1616 domain-containing protein [Haladaptatus cibarius]
MISKSTVWLLLPQPVRRFPADLAFVVALVLVACGVVLMGRGIWTPFRVVFGFLFLFFLPGYAVVAALFPESAEGARTTGRVGFSQRIDGVERLTLSVVASFAIAPLVGYVASYSPWGLSVGVALVSVGSVTVVCAVIAAIRRWSLPESERFSVPYRTGYARVKRNVSKETLSRPLNVVLVVSLIVASAGIVYTTTMPRSDEQFTEFYLATENETDRMVVADYPRNFTTGQAKSLHIGVQNNEYEPANYTVVILLQRVSERNGSATVTAERRLDRFSMWVEHGESSVQNRSIEPTMAGDRLRLVFLLYRGAPPPSPSMENAYRRTHLWVDVDN